MKKAALILLVMIFALGLFSLAQGEPSLTIPNSIFDFGFVPQHSKISHIFWLHSTGTDSLVIKKVSPG